MTKIYLGTFLLLSAFSYSQKKIEKGSYISTTQGQNIKLHLKENNQYELVVFYGDYSIKSDTLELGNNNSQETDFAVNFSSDANPAMGKVKVKLVGNIINYYGVYLGTQSGKASPSFQKLSDQVSDNSYENTETYLEINRSDYFYLVKEDYDGESTLNKYALPKDAKEIQIEYQPNYLGKVKLQGYLNDKNELVVVEKNKNNPLVFVEESKVRKPIPSKIKPLEVEKKMNWTYAGKDAYDAYGVVDSTSTAATSYKLPVHKDLQKAKDALKNSPSKFLVVSYDPDTQESKASFDEFIKNQEYALGSYMSYASGDATTDFDKFSYYNATSKDKAWALKNKIADNPSTIILDAEGNILSQTKGTVATNYYQFDVYSNTLVANLKQVKAVIDLNKALNSKAKEAVVLKNLVQLSEKNSAASSYLNVVAPPVVEIAAPVAVEEITSDVAVDSAATYSDYYNENNMVYTKTLVDRKKLLTSWDAIVKSHAKDTKPNMDFVKVASAEIEGAGFYKSIYNEERIYDEANFKAIDYLIKHYEKILEVQKKAEDAPVAYDYYGETPSNLDVLLPKAISYNMMEFSEQASSEYKNRILSAYKRVLEKQPSDYKSKIEYLGMLSSFSADEQSIVKEFDTFFTSVFKGSTNEIVILDEIFTQNASSGYYDEWTVFKNYFSNASNNVAWFVVEKSKNPDSIKKAIKWSESSLRIEKNNPYYLDTLAQLYYKNGEKQKAIATQEEALKLSESMDEETKSDLQRVLEKMKSGSY